MYKSIIYYPILSLEKGIEHSSQKYQSNSNNLTKKATTRNICETAFSALFSVRVYNFIYSHY